MAKGGGHWHWSQRALFVVAVLVGLWLWRLPHAQAYPGPVPTLEPGVLLWGGDAEGGGPYIFPRDDDPEQLQGFEVELVAAVARALGLQPKLVQAQWDKLPDMLRAGKIDVVVNGIEDTPERAAVLGMSRPYYVYALQLLARKDDSGTTSWQDLTRSRDGRPARIGVLTGSTAETWMRTFCQEECEVVSYDGNTDAMREVETGKLDATLQDTPIVQFYQPRFPALVRIGQPVGKGLYVALFNQDNPALRQAFDRALQELTQNGELKQIYLRYGLWDGLQAQLLPADSTGSVSTSGSAVTTTQLQQASKRLRGLEVWSKYGWMLVQAAGLTIVLTLLAFPLAVALGLGLALLRLYGPQWVAKVVAATVEILRGTPLMLQLYCLFFLLPEWGVNLPAFATGVFGLAVNYAASESELLRAGLQSVPHGQYEAALSVGLSRRQALRHVIIPQAFRTVLPPLVTDLIAMFKDTSVCSAITLIELTKRFQVLSMSTQATVELMALTALLYLAMSYPLARLAGWLETRLAAAPKQP